MDDKLVLEGKDSFGNPRQDFADDIAAASDVELVEITEGVIWLAACANNALGGDYRWQAAACREEAERRGKPEIYDQAQRQASGM